MNWIKSWRLLLAISLAGVLGSAGAAEEETAKTFLQWRNGESLHGEIAEATPEQISWKSPVFDEPILLQWDAVGRITSSRKSAEPAAPFAFALRDGSFVYGDIAEITPEHIVVTSPRHGEFRLKRAEVLRLRRTTAEKAAYLGPNGDVGWARKNLTPEHGDLPNSAVQPVIAGLGGMLHIPYWNANVGREIKLPESLLAEVHLHSPKGLDFRMDLIGKEKERLRLETWADSLVLTSGDSFALVRTIPAETKDLILHIGWDRKTKRSVVYSETGEQLVEWQVPEAANTGRREPEGITILNKRRDLMVDVLRVRSWDGSPPAKLDVQKPRVQLADGRSVPGTVLTAGAGKILMAANGDAPEQAIPFSEVTEVVFSTDRPEKTGGAKLVYADGTLIFGRIKEVKSGAAMLEVAFAENGFSSKVEGLRMLALERDREKEKAAAQQLAGLDQLRVGDLTLHGKFTGGGSSTPGWLPVGGLKPSALSQTADGEIRRHFPKGTEFPAAPALFYTTQGDVLPAALVSLDQSGVGIKSPLTSLQKLQASQLESISFAGQATKAVKGFLDEGWKVVKGTEDKIERKEETVTLRPDTAIGHPFLLNASEFSFRLKIQNYGAVRMRLFCAGTDAGKSTNVLVMKMGSRVSYALEVDENQGIDEQGQIQTKEQEIGVRMVIGQQTATLHIDDIEVRTFPTPLADRPGYGLILEPASMWGNAVQEITLSQFSSTPEPGGAWSPVINQEALLQTLTVPRFRKENPPRHVLIAANGDLLRGGIEAITSTHIGFLSGLEALKVPRDRVKAVVWVKKPGEGVVDNIPVTNRPKWMDQLLRSRARYSNANLGSVLNYLRNQVPEMKFKLPQKPDSQRRTISFAQQTVAAALDQIAVEFNVRYTIDDTGTVVLESGRGASDAMAERLYWIKSAKLPAPEAVMEMFINKGVPFPKGTAALWMPSRNQLQVTNSAENLQKLEAMLTAEYGAESYVALSHWVQLVNGGRLALKAQSFEADFVRGVHPVFGECVIPIADVISISNRSPQPTAAMRTLSGWQLTYAPEPVIPETGGESSPMLGTEPKPFKLPLLAGGEFDFAKEKGKVVVLDFWATWCGPCIKSLPGLMDAMLEFSPEQVTFLGVNQGEPAETVKRFLETRSWELKTVLDSNQTVGRDFKVEGIPHTVVIGQDGKVAWVKTGFTPTVGQEVADAVRRLLKPAQPGVLEPTAVLPAKR